VPRRVAVEALEWDDFSAWFDQVWQPGEHVSIVTPTGGGKTTLAVGLLELRRYVGLLAPKGVDQTLRALHAQRLVEWPGDRKMTATLDRDEKEGRPSHYVFGPTVSTYARDWPRLVTAYRDALQGMFRMQNWTAYVDDLQLLVQMGLGTDATQWLISARSRHLSFVSAFQVPRRVLTAALHEPTWIFASQTRDATVVDRTAEVLGRPKAEVRGLLEETSRFTWLCIGRDPNAPVMVTMPPKRS
jgi:hypothetical protein